MVKRPQNEKNVAKRPPYEEKVAKGHQYSPNIYSLFSRGGGGGGGGGATAYSFIPASAHACNRVALIITISCIKSEY